MHYEIVTSAGETIYLRETSPEVKKVLETHKITEWVGGSAGICDDWGRPVEKRVKKIIRHNGDGTEDLLYEKPEKKKGFYYIENTIDERRTKGTGYFTSLKSAKEAMKLCSDWFFGNGTGCIYFQPYGLKEPREFVCRGKGLDENKEVIFTTEQF